MRRRDFIGLIGGAAAGWPLAARAQQPAVPVVGVLRDALPDNELAAALVEGLNEVGYRDGQNVRLDFRWTEGHGVGLSVLAVDLIRAQVAVIVAGGDAAIHSAKLSTATIPVVFASGEDPIKAGFVDSLDHPNGNLTGASFYSGSAQTTKQLQLIDQLVPNASLFGLLVNPKNPNTELIVRETATAARSLGVKIHLLNASNEADFEPAFASLIELGVKAIIVSGDTLFTGRRAQLVASAERYAIPAIYSLREFAQAGGLMSYGSMITNAYRQAGVYAGRILKGEKPADLPVAEATKVELIINLKTAKALGLTIPESIRSLADEVIE